MSDYKLEQEINELRNLVASLQRENAELKARLVEGRITIKGEDNIKDDLRWEFKGSVNITEPKPQGEARLIEGPKKKLVMCERCKVVTDWYGLDRACKCGCPNFCDLDPKPQGEE